MTHWLWIVFGVIVTALLAFDLGIVGRHNRILTTRQALYRVAGYVAVGMGFGTTIFLRVGDDAGLEFLAAYFLEQSLSLDNIFVWVLIFQHFQVPEEAQHKVLFWGILGAMVLRGAFIFTGTALVKSFEWLLYVFGGIVIASGLRLLASSRPGHHHEVGGSRLVRLLQRHLPINPGADNRHFFVRSNGRIEATSLFVALLVIETTDVAFALDSIPAIFGVTHDPFIVYTSNVFAILGLRALFFVVAGLIDRLRFLRPGLALLLVLIGAKMIGSHFVELPVWLTLVVTLLVLSASIGASLLARPAQSSGAREGSQ